MYTSIYPVSPNAGALVCPAPSHDKHLESFMRAVSRSDTVPDSQKVMRNRAASAGPTIQNPQITLSAEKRAIGLAPPKVVCSEPKAD